MPQGPVPPPPPPGLQASSSGWGGLDAGPGMLYPAQVVDGLTHMHAGSELRAALAAQPSASADGKRCHIGGAVLSRPFRLAHTFDIIAHTPTPFWPSGSVEGSREWQRRLNLCYVASILALVERAPLGQVWHAETTDATRWCDEGGANVGAPRQLAVASPLLGAGAAGAPIGAAAEVAVGAIAQLSECDLGRPLHVRLALSDQAALEAVEQALAEEHRGRGRLFLA